MQLLDIYKSILSAAGMVTDGDGYVSVNNELFADMPNVPAMIGEKRLVLPTEDHMRNPSSSKILFHPLREQAMQGESEVVAKLRQALGVRLNFTIAAIVSELLRLCTPEAVAEQNKFSPDQADLLTIGKEVTQDTLVAFTELLIRAEKNAHPTKIFVSLFVKKNAVVGETNYFRAGVVTFPFYETLVKEEKPYGLTITKRDRNNIKHILEYLIPGIDKEHTYDRGSNSGVAPYLEGLMKSFGAVASRLNDMYNLFANFINMDKLVIPYEWEAAFEDLDKLLPQIQYIPTQPGNEGRTEENKTTTLQAVLAQQQQPQAQRPPQPQPTPAPQPVVHQTANGLDWRSVASSLGMAPANQPYQQPVMFNPANGNGVHMPRSDWGSNFAPAPGQQQQHQQYVNINGQLVPVVTVQQSFR